ncbi:MAG: amidase family protein [Anaerolineae bacterium]
MLLKDNIDAAGMPTTAGALALARSVPAGDAFVTARLRAAGAVILGKTNLTEFANFMASRMPSGYSSLGGQVLNPYDASITPSGSSAGSAVAVAAGLSAVSVGTETSGSILSPSGANSIVGVKPTIGLVSRTGILPICATQDTPGPMARTVRDAAILLGVLAGPDPEDPATLERREATVDYAAALSDTALAGARIGIVGNPPTGGTGQAYQTALAVLRARGAEVEEAVLQTGSRPPDILAEEFRRDLNAYLARLPADAPMRSLRDIVAFNDAHRAAGSLKFGQDLLVAAEAIDLADPAIYGAYAAARATALTASRACIDTALDAGRLDALLFLGSGSALVGAMAGYPSVAVPVGYNPNNGRPVGITLLAGPFTEARLLGFAYDYEQAAAVRRPPSEVNPSLFRGVRIDEMV